MKHSFLALLFCGALTLPLSVQAQSPGNAAGSGSGPAGTKTDDPTGSTTSRTKAGGAANTGTGSESGTRDRPTKRGSDPARKDDPTGGPAVPKPGDPTTTPAKSGSTKRSTRDTATGADTIGNGGIGGTDPHANRAGKHKSQNGTTTSTGSTTDTSGGAGTR